ncbi:MAG: hypothetical protein L3K06_04235 [Thermoplasmata archaeon]|nr:hypothetical protein [Thermoplasmata archaeon]
MSEVEYHEAEVTGGLTGRAPVRPVRVPPDEDTLAARPDPDGPWMPSLPSRCLKVLNTITPQDEDGQCSPECPGRSIDDTCILDTVRRALAQGVEYHFEIDRDGFWYYDGPPLA